MGISFSVIFGFKKNNWNIFTGGSLRCFKKGLIHIKKKMIQKIYKPIDIKDDNQKSQELLLVVPGVI